jgi:hypothetical protein
MPVDTYIDRARTRVQAEQEAVDAKREAYETFINRVTKVQTDPTPSPSSGMTAATGTHLAVDSPPDDHCRTVRTVFAETIRPHSIDDIDGSESLLETIREEFTDTIAVALAQTTDASFAPELKRMVLSEAQARHSEATALRKVLDREHRQLEETGNVVDDITVWIAEADETPLTDLGFGALARRHERLATHRNRCEELAHQRQDFLQQTTNNSIEVGIRHQSLIPYLYQDFPVDHPVLATVARLDDTCEDCQRVVRAHLTRRA